MSDFLAQLNALEFLSLRLHMRAEETMRLPAYKGSTLRGAFGSMFKDTVCVVAHRDCERCVLKANCAYPYVFETPVPRDSVRMRKYPASPHPFVILPSLDKKRTYMAGETLTFDLTLIGRGIEYLPYFIFTFAQFSERRGLGRERGRCTLVSAQWQAPEGQWIALYDGRDGALSDDYRTTTLADLDNAKATEERQSLTFLTPTRLIYQGHLVSDLQFHILFRILLRRLSNLLYFHAGVELDADFRGLIEMATKTETVDDQLQWYDWKRYSARQRRKIRQGGLVGDIVYKGDFQIFGPVLQLGTVIHVGKGTSFGLGKYQMA